MRESAEDIQKRLNKRDSYYEELSHSIWLMNDHRWALLAWEKCCKPRPAIIAHLDWHWDGVNEFSSQEACERLLTITGPEELERLIAEDCLVTRDSFIAPAIIRGISDEVHFFCLQNDTQPGLTSQLPQQYETIERRHSSIESLIESVKNSPKPLIMDLDLDLFNRATPFYSAGCEMNTRVIAFIEKCSFLFQRAEVVTIAKSPGAWWINNQNQNDWDTELSEQLARIIVPRLVSIRSK